MFFVLSMSLSATPAVPDSHVPFFRGPPRAPRAPLARVPWPDEHTAHLSRTRQQGRPRPSLRNLLSSYDEDTGTADDVQKCHSPLALGRLTPAHHGTVNSRALPTVEKNCSHAAMTGPRVRDGHAPRVSSASPPSSGRGCIAPQDAPATRLTGRGGSSKRAACEI